jgi:hypothetical protein
MKSASDLLAGRPDRIQPYPPHPIAERLPSTVGVLTESVRAKDLHDIVLFEGKILMAASSKKPVSDPALFHAMRNSMALLTVHGTWYSHEIWSALIGQMTQLGSNQHHSDGDPLFLRVGRISLPLLSTLS